MNALSPTVLTGMVLVEGDAEGPAAVSPLPVSVARIDPDTGILHEAGHPLDGCDLAGTILLCPTGKGSSSGSYVLLNLAHRKLAPAAIVTAQADAVLIAGAVLANIPLLTGCDPALLRSVAPGARLRVNGKTGTVSVQCN